MSISRFRTVKVMDSIVVYDGDDVIGEYTGDSAWLDVSDTAYFRLILDIWKEYLIISFYHVDRKFTDKANELFSDKTLSIIKKLSELTSANEERDSYDISSHFRCSYEDALVVDCRGKYKDIIKRAFHIFVDLEFELRREK